MPIKVLQITDLHVFADHSARLKGIPTRETLIDVLADIQANHADLDVMVVTGDHTHDELADTYRDLSELLLPWKDRLFQIPGNHDDRVLIRSTFPNHVRPLSGDCVTFSTTVGEWRLIGLDSHLPGEVAGHLETEQIAWLADELKNGQPTGLFIHHPPVDVASEWMDAIGINNSDELLPILDASPHVKFICAGHVHHEFSCSVGHATMYTTPSTGIQFDPNGSRPTFSDLPPGYRILQLNDDGTFETQVQRLPEAKYTPVVED